MGKRVFNLQKLLLGPNIVLIVLCHSFLRIFSVSRVFFCPGGVTDCVANDGDRPLISKTFCICTSSGGMSDLGSAADVLCASAGERDMYFGDGEPLFSMQKGIGCGVSCVSGPGVCTLVQVTR